jgi:tetratricopeptide (TPR) repeat protein
LENPLQNRIQPGAKNPSRLILWTGPIAAFLFISILGTLVYLNSLGVSFHFDDTENIVENPFIKRLGNLLNPSSILFGGRIVGYFTFALNYRFGGLSVFGYHLINLIIHISNALLVYGFIRLLVQSPRMNTQPSLTRVAPAIALGTALLFVTHPVQTQAVTYIVQRFASLAALFYLLTVIAYLKWRLSTPESKHRHLWYATAFIATVLGMKTKETTFTLPFMLLLVEFVFFGPPTRKQWLALTPFFLTLPIIPFSRPDALGTGSDALARAATDLGRWDYLCTQFRVIMTYLRLLVWPVDQNLAYDYPASHSLLDPPVFLSFLFLSALFAAAVYLVFLSRRAAADPRLRLIGFGLLWFFVTLSIESSIIPIRDVINEHRLYLPSAGLFLGVGVAVLGYAGRARVWAAMGIGLLVLIFSVLTFERNLVWRDELSLWTDVVRKSPNLALGYYSLGAAFANQGKLDEAIKNYARSLELDPKDPRTHYDLANAYKKAGRIEESIREYQSAITLVPGYAEAHNNLGIVYEERGQMEDAFREYQTALRFKPYLADAHNNMGVVYKKMGRTDDAVLEYRKAIALDPAFVEAYNNLGTIYKNTGRLQEAVRVFRAVVALRPDDPEAHNRLGILYVSLGHVEEGIREYQAAIHLKPDYAGAYNNLGLALYQKGQFAEAQAALETGLKINPDDGRVHLLLGIIEEKRDQFDEAILHLETSLKLLPDIPETYYYLGTAYHRKGQTQNALNAFKRALQLRPNYEDARQALKALGP